MDYMKRFTIDLPDEIHKRLKIYCAENDTNMAEVIRVLVEELLAVADKKKKK